eukprot:m.25569 g.25569  ORF g.25569 m.25569 type:complete len:330 (+) comp4182_c0_seq1:130-1119(+)
MEWPFDISALVLVCAATFTIAYGAIRAVRSSPHADQEFQLGAREALLFPVAGSAMLLLLFYYFKSIQSIYILMCVVTTSTCSFLCFQPINFIRPRPLVGSCTTSDLSAAIISAALIALWILYNNWVAIDILGATSCIAMLSFIRVSSTKVVLVLFAGLLVYDIFWVFYSDRFFRSSVMLEVAESQAGNPLQSAAEQLSVHVRLPTLSLPAMLSVPRWDMTAVSILGLGDMFVPGLMVVHALRQEEFFARMGSTVPLFRGCLIGYVAGLLIAIAAARTFDTPQPALLYILPCVCLPAALLALRSGLISAWLHADLSDTRTARSCGKILPA